MTDIDPNEEAMCNHITAIATRVTIHAGMGTLTFGPSYIPMMVSTIAYNLSLNVVGGTEQIALVFEDAAKKLREYQIEQKKKVN